MTAHTNPDEQAILEMAAVNLADLWECERDMAFQDPQFARTPHSAWTPDALLDDVSSNQAQSYYEDGIRTSDDAYGLAYCLTLLENRPLITARWDTIRSMASAIYLSYQQDHADYTGRHGL